MTPDLWLAGLVAGVVFLCLVIYSLGYSQGKNDSNKKILEHQQQAEAAQRWKEVLEKMQGGLR